MPRFWTWIGLGSLICLTASRSSGKVRAAVRLSEGPGCLRYSRTIRRQVEVPGGVDLSRL